MDKDSSLKRVLSFEDLTLFGIASIMGSGGFNLIGDGIIAGGSQFPMALGAVATLFQGTSVVYQEAYNEFKTNTAESDLVQQELGIAASTLSSITILVFNLITVSVILVLCSKLLFPKGTWAGQISFALVLLSVMCGVALQGIELDTTIITAAGFLVVALLAFASMIGLIEIGSEGLPSTAPKAIQQPPNVIQSILYFFFVLAGFDTLIKFTEETREPDKDLARSFYASNALSTILTVGICMAFLVVFTHHTFHENDNIIARIVGTMLGSQAEQATAVASIGLMAVTGFICFLASTRYMFSLTSMFQELNEAKAPWKAIAVATGIIALGILNNHVYTLVRLCDVAITVTLLLVSAAATKLQAGKGKVPWIEGLTTLGLGALLSIATLYK